jgi:hypothetical protein
MAFRKQKGRLRLRPLCCKADVPVTATSILTRCTLTSRTIKHLPQEGEVKRANQPPDGGRINRMRAPMLRASVWRLDAAEPCAREKVSSWAESGGGLRSGETGTG